MYKRVLSHVINYQHGTIAFHFINTAALEEYSEYYLEAGFILSTSDRNRLVINNM